MPNTLWMLLVCVILVIIAQFVTHAMIRTLMYVLALIVAVVAVVRLTGIG